MNKKELPERIIGRFWSIIDLSLAIPYSTSTENLVLLPQSEQYEGGHEWAFTQPSHVASLISYFSNTFSAVNINILGLYKAFWYTGSAFTRYFNHNLIMLVIYATLDSWQHTNNPVIVYSIIVHVPHFMAMNKFNKGLNPID